jgi:hypothetical protein
VTSGVPQGTILGPALFLVYINDMPDEIQSTAKLFADDTKLYRQINSVSDCVHLQKDLDNLATWSQKWQLRFNEGKCVVLKTKNKIPFDYSLNGIPLQEATEQKDLGVLISNTLTPRNHILQATKKANQRIGLIKRCFSDLSDTRTTTLYTTIVRPLIEYGSPAWAPWHQKDKIILDKVQSRCLRLSKNKITLQSLNNRRQSTDLCEVYKYMHNLYKTPSNTFFTPAPRALRGHPLKLQKQYARTEVRRNFFSNRMVDPWNKLPEEIVTSNTLARFKRQLRSLAKCPEGTSHQVFQVSTVNQFDSVAHKP